MNEYFPKSPVELSGKLAYRLRSILGLYRSLFYVTFRRMLHGPLRPGWSWSLEMATHFLKSQTAATFDIADIVEGREYEDSLLFRSTALPQVSISPVQQPIRGHWYQPQSGHGPATLLYLHGGGYAYYSKSHHNLIALITLAARTRTFALDYRLIPEHPFPAQLEDGLAAYRWLLESGIAPERIVLAGDSAGGNLVLALLLSLRDDHIPLPALAIGLCPWTDVTNPGESMQANAASDWVEKRMADRWAGWLCQNASPNDPLVSPVRADLAGLPPIYLQAGGAEILHDMIVTFANRAIQQGANVTLEVWPEMVHDFQAFGDMFPESKAALKRIAEMVQAHISPADPIIR